MAITENTREKLWTKAGNRCSICKTELFSNKEDTEELSIGEECQIISNIPEGPRYKVNLEDYDLYDNLILVCKIHRKEIDELSETYTEELLRYIKKTFL